MPRLNYYAAKRPLPEYTKMLRAAARSVWPAGVALRPCKRIQDAMLLLDPTDTYQDMVDMFEWSKGLMPWPEHDAETLYFDIETHNAEKRWDMPLEEFFRLGQYAWGLDGEVHLTFDFHEMQEICKSAYGLVAHNGHYFDFSVMLGDEALTWARQNRLFDTMVFANLANPAPFFFQDREGHKNYMEVGGTPKVVPHTMKWLSLDNQAFQFDVPGKVESLKDLAVRHNPPKTKQADLDFGLIPVDDPDFQAYGIRDVVVLKDVSVCAIAKHPITDYDWREQLCAAINAQISRNGWLMDVPQAEARVSEIEVVKERLLTELHNKYDFPTEGKSPWRSNAGKAAIFAALSDFGLVPSKIPGWPMLKTGPSLSGEVLKEYCEGTPAEEFAANLILLAGQRPLAAQALVNVHKDGKVHPSISFLQRSGRNSTTKPSLATWTARGDNAREKSYFLPDPGCKLVAFDMSNADARAVAAMSIDYEFAKRFDDDVDAHELTGRFVFGDKLYDSDPDTWRYKSKQCSHGWNYGIGAKKLAKQAKITLEHAYTFMEFMANSYQNVIRWQGEVRAEAEIGYATNRWGRRMMVDPDRAYTQAPALHGQSSTREAMFDGLIKMPDEVLRMLKITVHDEVVFSFPEHRIDELSELVVRCMEFEWNGIKFPLNRGPVANNWYEASH